MNKIDIPKTQSVMAVIFMPIPGALAISIIAFNYITSISHWSLGILGGLGAFFGVEAVGGASCYALIKCLREKDFGFNFLMSSGGVIAYVGGGVLTLYFETPIFIFFGLSPFAYFAYSVIRTIIEEWVNKAKETEAQTAQTNAQVELIKAQTRLTNAQIRKQKVSVQNGVQNVQNADLHTINLQRQAEKLANLNKVLDYLTDNPEASLSAISEHIGKGKSTARNYTDELMADGKLTKNGNGWEVVR